MHHEMWADEISYRDKLGSDFCILLTPRGDECYWQKTSLDHLCLLVTKFISMIIEKNGIPLTMAFPIQDNN